MKFTTEQINELTGISKSKTHELGETLPMQSERVQGNIGREWTLQDWILIDLTVELQRSGFSKAAALMIGFAIEPELFTIVSTERGSYFGAVLDDEGEWTVHELKGSAEALDFLEEQPAAIMLSASKLVKQSLQKIVLMNKKVEGSA